MKPLTAMKTLPLLLAGMAAFHVRAGTLDHQLQTAIADRHPGDKIDVIVRCIDPVDPVRVPAEDLVSALRNKANACETSLANAFKDPSASPRTLWIINGIAVTVPVANLNGLVNRAGVDRIYLNQKVRLPPAPVPTGTPGNPPLTYWNISEIRADDLWALGNYGTGVVVATMDTGVDADHADLGPNWRGGNNSWYDPNGQHATPFDSHGHGTGVMGLIVGGNAGGFDIGVAPDARWIAVKIFDDSNESSYEKIHLGFQWLLDPDGDQDPIDAPDILNNSWVLQGTEDQCLGEFAGDIAALKAMGVAVVFSGGNFGPNPRTSMDPANDPESLSVGAVDSLLNVISASSRGPSACDGGFYPKVAAPGKDVLTAGLTTSGSNPTNYAFGTGTSYAAPHVAGAMALLKSAVPGASVSEIEAAIRDGAFDLGISGPDNDSGAGMLDVVEAFYVLDGSGTPRPGDLQFSAATYSGTENGGSLAVTVTRTGGGDGAVGVDYATADGTAAAGADYMAASGTLDFADGELNRTFTVTILDDEVYEGDENLHLALSNPTGGAALGTTANAVLTILEDDPLPNNPPAITSNPVTEATEGESYRYDVAATDPDPGDVLAFSLDAFPAGMTIDSVSGLIDWTPGGQTGPNDVTVRVTDTGGLFAVQSFTVDVSEASPGIRLYFSTAAKATIPGVSGPYDDADIYLWDGNDYSRVFDASAAGLPGNADVDALVVDGSVYYMSFRRNGGTNVPGLGLVDDEDIVKYEAGAWSLYFDGGAVGLADTNGEDVDGFALLANGDILVSIVGSAEVPGLSGRYRDEDLLRCQATAVPVTDCSWSMYFDGSDVALNNSAGEDVDGVSVSSDGNIRLSTVNAFNVAGLSGNDEDVFVCNSPTTGTRTACTSLTMLFDGDAEGIVDDLDAIDLP